METSFNIYIYGDKIETSLEKIIGHMII